MLMEGKLDVNLEKLFSLSSDYASNSGPYNFMQHRLSVDHSLSHPAPQIKVD